ncbi:hypothetical protein Nepgr_026704 [Nepenthes gracilis]|uniref:RING-type domain-containing protein n=1 Tax=Nepenthes gracilis TaxID=150966 RepID=A0AAD3TA81_NEPGR|nr:hypothetical protein Nepgr_026704 [Nepenthes gracilis]
MEFLKRLKDGQKAKVAQKTDMAGAIKEARREMETPPDDDVCPICFSDFTLPCRANCGHWFCGSCILQVWNHGSAFETCKCPMCCRHIASLTPNLSLHQENESEARKVMNAIGRYNRLFVGGPRGLVLRVRETPLLIGRMLREMTDPNQFEYHLLKWRCFAMMLGILYMVSPFDFLPQGVNILNLCNFSAVLMVCLLKLVGLYRKYRSAQRVRQLADSEPHIA